MWKKCFCFLLVFAIFFTSTDLSVLAQEMQELSVSGNSKSISENTIIESEPTEEKTIENEQVEDSNLLSSNSESGQCGDNLTWKIEGDTLIISGTGDMWDYEVGTNFLTTAPWGIHGDEIVSLRLEKGVTYIGKNAFYGCSRFSGDLIIPNDVIEIGEGAFCSCNGFNGNLIIPDSVTKIGRSAFNGCSGFNGNLIIPEKVTEIGVYAFLGCSGFSGNLIIPNGVTEIGDSAFQECSGFNGNLIISEGVTKIGEATFLGCSGFNGKLTIPDSVTEIGAYAFSGCSGFNDILTISETIIKIGNGAFHSCSGLSGDLIIPDGVTEIGEYIFAGCRGLSGNLNIPDGVIKIGAGAFYRCNGFNGNLVIPDSITEIGNYAFYECNGFKKVIFYGEAPVINSAIFENVAVEVYYPSWKSGWSNIINNNYGGTLTWIPYNEDVETESATGKCGDNLTWTVVGDTLTISGTGDMWDYGYEDMGMGEYIESPWKEYDNISTIKIENGITRIGDYAFNGYKNLVGDLVIPEGVTSIGESAFSGCTGFNGSLVLPDTLTDIGMNAFAGCSGFTGELKIPAGITEITHGAFNQCSGFSGDLVIPEGVKVVGWASFNGCTGFKGNLILPESITTIEDNAFGACSGFTGELKIPKGMKVIGSYVFAGCSGFTGELLIPENVTNIGPRAFWQCRGFTGDLNLSEYVVWIGECAFAECSGLSGTAYIRGELENIGENTFTTITKIYGRAGTLVETYAKNNNIDFEELDDLPIQEIVKVETASDLMKISDNVSKGVTDYKGQTIEIAQDIDLSSETWVPIGNTSRPFRGNIQGNGYTISGIRSNDAYGGLIGCWASQESSYIENLIVEDIQLTGKRSGGIVSTLWVDENDQADISNVTVKGTINGISLISGGVVGAISGNGKVQISGCNIDVSMYSGPVYNDNYGCIGGVVGSATDSGSGELIISSCIVNGNITTEQTYSYCSSEAGGIIGLSKVKTLKIEQCSKKGRVSCKAYYAHTGGLIGSAEIRSDSSLIISDSYVNADITSTCTNGNSQCGGFIGHTSGTGGNPIKITNSYVTGSMDADNKAAFVCWYSEYVCPTIQNCYFDMAKLGLSKEQMVCHLETFSKDWLSDNITNSSGLSTDGMKVVGNYVGWDFENVWSAYSDINAGYPILRWEVSENDEEEIEEDIKDIALSFGGTKKLVFSHSLFAVSSMNYDENISELSICLSTMVYETDGKDEKEEHKRIARNFQKLGFDTEEEVDDFINEHYFEDETGHSIDQTIQGNYSPFWIVNSEIDLDGNIYNLIFVVVRGSYDMEWIDNFDSGIGDTHMGFERAAVRVVERLNEYIQNNGISGNIKVLVTGHSRGAAVANLIGKKIDDGEIDALKDIDKSGIFVYTYATPNVALEGNSIIYNNIYNIINPEDFVTKLVPKKWGYDRYGITYVLPSISLFPNGLILKDDGHEYGVEYKDFVEAVSEKVGSYRPEAEEYKEYNPYNWGMYYVVKYVDSIIRVVPDIFGYYSTGLTMPIEDIKFYSKAGESIYNSLFSMFKTSLAYYNTSYYHSIGQHTLLNASLIWGTVGADTTWFFVWNGALTKQFGCAHTAETYMAMLDLIPKWVLEQKKVFNKYIVNCPVDIVVKDKNGNVLGKIEQNEVCTTTDELAMLVEGESKSFLMHERADYTIELIGNNSGTMDYSILKYDADIGEIGRDIYLNLPLEKGVVYTHNLNGEDDAGDIPLLDSDSNIIEKTMTLGKDQISTLSVKVNIVGNGFAQGYENLSLGDYVIMYASTNEYNEFLGWYDKDGNLLSKNEEYGFSIKKNEEVTARFTDNNEEAEIFTVTFNSNGGSEVPKQTVEENQKATKPENPVYEGYVFKGWYLGDKLYDFEKLVTADITLKAKWEKEEIEQETLPSPTANIASGSVVKKGTKIVLSSETEGVQIYYTLDGSNPTTASSLYTNPIVLTEATTIKAMVVKEGFNNSGVSVFTYTLKISEDNSNEDDKKEDETLEDNKQEGENIGEKVESENNNDIVFNVQLGESKRDELEYNKFSLKENKKIKDTFAPYIKENNDDILNEIAEVSDKTDENNEKNVYNEESRDDITTDMGEVEDDTSTDTEKDGLGAATMGSIIIGLGLVFMYIKSKKRQH